MIEIELYQKYLKQYESELINVQRIMYIDYRHDETTLDNINDANNDDRKRLARSLSLGQVAGRSKFISVPCNEHSFNNQLLTALNNITEQYQNTDPLQMVISYRRDNTVNYMITFARTEHLQTFELIL